MIKLLYASIVLTILSTTSYALTLGRTGTDFTFEDSFNVPYAIQIATIVPVGGAVVHYVYWFGEDRNSIGGTVNVRLYNDSGGLPNAAITAISTITVTSSATPIWHQTNLDYNLTLTAGTTVWVGIMADAAMSCRIYAVTVPNNYTWGNYGGTGLSDTWNYNAGWNVNTDKSWSMYVDYTVPSSGGVTYSPKALIQGKTIIEGRGIFQ